MSVTHVLHTFRPLRQLMAAVMLLLSLPLCAQEVEDSVFTFRFFVGKNEFYAPGLGNGDELAKMYACVDRYKDLIVGRDGVVHVEGYSTSDKSGAENLAIARTRSNRVKSELITNKGLKERNFYTRNYTGKGNFVNVSINIPKDRIQSTPQVTSNESPQQTEQTGIIDETLTITDEITPPIDEITSLEEKTLAPAEDSMVVAGDSVAAAEAALVSIEESGPDGKRMGEDSPFALKTNLLDYAILMPNLEVEWMFTRRWSAALEGQVAWYGKETPHKIYKIATVMPEVRYWVIERARWHGMYVGVFGGVGMYDLCNEPKKNGHLGEAYAVGASVGYMWPIARHLSLEAGLGVGFMRARDKKYRPLDGHYLYQLTKHLDYFGPLRLKLSLIWRIPK